MAGTVTTTEETYGVVKMVKFSWTSSAGGAADATTTEYYSGAVERMVTVPGSGGDAPTAAYDVAITDKHGIDVLLGAGANRSATAQDSVLAASLGFVANTQLTLAVTNAGNAKSGTVYLYIR